jgi:hypothetical protein
MIASTLQLRMPALNSDKRRILNRFASFDRSILNLVKEGIWYELHRRPTLGAEWYCLRGAVSNRMLNRYYQLKSGRIYRHELALRAAGTAAAVLVAPMGSDVVAAPQPASGANLLAGVEIIREKIAPLTLDVTERAPRRVNLLVPTVDFRYLFGGYLGKLNLALHLKRAGYRARVVITDWCDYAPAVWKRQILGYPGLSDFFDQVDVRYCFDRAQPLEVSPNDAFIATTWWTAHIAHQAVMDLGQDRFVYLIQEYEPMTFPMGSFYALAEQTYTFPHRAIFSTELLRDYFRQHCIGVFTAGRTAGNEASVSFQNAINAFDVRAERLQQRTTHKLLYYARPEQHAARNMFELGILALQDAIRQGAMTAPGWEFHGIGTVGSTASIQLASGAELKLLPRLDLREYLELLPGYDVGMSLMLTPHPSLVPLEMAAAGMLTVTNTFENKSLERLQELSTNLIAVPPTIEGIASGLVTAAGDVCDVARRVAGSRVHWSTSWDEALGGDVMQKVREFIA